MRAAEREVGISRGLARRLLPVTLGIGLIISLIFPVAFYTLQLDDLDHEAGIYAESLAHRLAFVFSESSALWKYQTVKYLQILDEFMPEKGLAVIRVLDEAGRPIPEYTHTVEPLDRWGPFRPHMGKASLLFDRRPIGTVEVWVSQATLLRQSLIIFLAWTAVGIGLASVAYFFPVTIVTRLERRLKESVEAAERANTRLGALVKANQILTVSLDTDETLQNITHEAAAISGAPMARLLLLEGEGKVLRSRVSEGLPPDVTTGLMIPIGESFSGQVAATGEPLAIADTRGDSRELYPDTVRYGLVSYLGLPVKRGGQVLGVLALNTNAPRVYSLEEIELLSAFAAQAAIAIENARLHEATVRRGEQLETVRAVSIEITRELDLTAVLHLITERVVELVGGGQGMIRLWDGDSQSLVQRTFTGNGLNQNSAPLRLGEGVAGTAAQRRQGIIVNDFRTSPYAIPYLLNGTSHTAVLAEPLLYGDRLVGVLSILREAGQQPFTEEDQQILAIFTAQAATAIENARLHDSAIRRGAELEALLLSSKAIGSSLDLNQVLQAIVEQAAVISAVPTVRLFLLDKEAQLLRCRVAVGFPLKNEPDLVIPLGTSFSGQVAVTGEPLAIADTRGDPRTHYPTHASKYGVVSYLGLPVKFRDRILGVLVFNTPAPRRYSADEMAYLFSFASQAAIAIENARLHETAVRHGAQMEALLSTLRTLTSGLDLREILDRILGEAIRISGTPHVKVLLLDKTTMALRVGAIKGSGMPPANVLPAGASLSGLVVQSGEALFIADAQNDLRNLWRERDRELGILTYLGLPIKKGEEVLGVLTLNNTFLYQYTPEEMILLTSFAAQAAIAIENARLHEEVTRHATTLETRVRERTTELARINLELTAALRQAEAGNQAKNDFLINMSHELRTPLNSVLGFAQLLREQAKEGLTAKQRRYLDNIYNSGQHLLALVNEILDMDTVERGGLRLDLTAVRLAEVITEALDATREAMRHKNHSVHALLPPDLPAVTADRDRVRQIVVNLLSNAVKFTPDGGTVTVRVGTVSAEAQGSGGAEAQGSRGAEAQRSRGAEEQGSGGAGEPGAPVQFVEIAVTDTGIGIRAEDLPRLFQAFAQLESPLTKRYEGTGIGLALTKKLVELHGGTITAASPGAGQGSTFTVRLPFGGPTGRAEA